MSFWESLRVAFTALRANKLRSLLTMLGVIIGVGSVIIMISIVQGARQKVMADFRGDGSNILFGEYSPRGDNRHGGSYDGLDMADMAAIRRRVDSVDIVAPEVDDHLQLTHGAKDYSANCHGVTADYLDVSTATVARGRFLSDDDQRTWAKVCVIGDSVRKHLFKTTEDALGTTIFAQAGGKNVPLTVVGIMTHRGGGGFGPSEDENVYIPISTCQKRLIGSTEISRFEARASSNGDGTEQAADQVFTVLKTRHPDHAKDFIVDTQEGLIKRLDSLLAIFQLILGGVGGLSLLVGGIGIMNIMLVSVTERTREIGIRKAVGAKRGDILLQFVTESMTVSGMGGLIGVGFGYGVSKVIGLVAGDNLPTFVPLWAAGLGFGFAVGVGMFFGIYPAFRAAGLDPIQALRYE